MTNTVIPRPAAAEWLMFLVRKSSTISDRPLVRQSRLVPRWVIPAAVLFLLADFVPAPGAEIAQLALGLAAFGRIAYRILGMSDAEWDPGPAADPLSSARLTTAPTVV